MFFVVSKNQNNDMQHLNFTIGKTRNCAFTQDQLAKVEAGLAIFLNIVASSNFREKILNFSWKHAAENDFDRFHLSNALSNAQVFDTLIKAKGNFYPIGDKSPVAILPCCSRKDIQAYMNLSTPTIWINTSWLNNEWYTAVHVAACICHEMCINRGFRCQMHGQLVANYQFTVPYACADFVRLIAIALSNEDENIRAAMPYILNTPFEYYPCSTVFNMDDWHGEVITCHQEARALVNRLAMEIDHLKTIQEPLSPKEFIRLEAAEKCVAMLKQMQSMLVDTSLDASDAIGVVLPFEEAVLTP